MKWICLSGHGPFKREELTVKTYDAAHIDRGKPIQGERAVCPKCRDWVKPYHGSTEL